MKSEQQIKDIIKGLEKYIDIIPNTEPTLQLITNIQITTLKGILQDA